MDNNSNNNLDPKLPPALPNDQPANPAPTAPAENPTGPTLHNTGVPLGSPILEPTHFDNMQHPEPTPIVTPPAPKPTNAEKNAKIFQVLTIVFGVLAVICIGLGIWGLISNINTNEQLEIANNELAFKNTIIAQIEEDTGTTITSVDTIPEYNAVPGYIYIPQWGIKFKIPDDLTDVSFTVDQKYRPQVCFAGYKVGVKYFPAFADIDQNPNGEGCVTRVATYEGDSDKDTGISFGQKVFTYGEYNYFYVAPSGHFADSEAEQGLEDTAVQIIKNMISMNISHYE